MDEARNPFAPGAGNAPPELAGRNEIIEQASVLLTRAKLGRHAKSFMLIGLRGVGKTVLLNKILDMALERGLHAQLVEAPEDKSLPELLVPALRRILIELNKQGPVSEVARRGLRVLVGFAKRLKVKYGDLEVGVDIDPESGVGDSGDLESDLPDLLVAVGEAAKARKTTVVLLIDELQYISELELSALIMGVHKTSQRQLPVVLVAAGLPQLVGNMGRSKSYAERLFDFPVVGPLNWDDARSAIADPIKHEKEAIADAAVKAIFDDTKGYPFFIQTWGYHAWNAAPRSPITRHHVAQARAKIQANLDSSFFRVRFDRLTPSEKRYLRAMAELGPGPHRSGEIARVLQVKVTSVAPTRSSLIKKGMVYAPSHGDTAFTVPLFDEFMKRQMPELDEGW
jgi:hypothetical protein